MGFASVSCAFRSIKTFQTVSLSGQAITAEKEASSLPIFGSEKGNAAAK
jgi:hypothetical protein